MSNTTRRARSFIVAAVGAAILGLSGPAVVNSTPHYADNAVTITSHHQPAFAAAGGEEGGSPDKNAPYYRCKECGAPHGGVYSSDYCYRCYEKYYAEPQSP